MGIAFPGQERARHMGQLQRGDQKWDVFLEVQPDGELGAVRGRLHFGLEPGAVVDSLEVRWPSGQVDTFKNLAVNRLYVVTEGAKSPQAVALR